MLRKKFRAEDYIYIFRPNQEQLLKLQLYIYIYTVGSLPGIEPAALPFRCSALYIHATGAKIVYNPIFPSTKTL
jgi:hypothetical protein